jgi:hypothetical protein
MLELIFVLVALPVLAYAALRLWFFIAVLRLTYRELHRRDRP